MFNWRSLFWLSQKKKTRIQETYATAVPNNRLGAFPTSSLSNRHRARTSCVSLEDTGTMRDADFARIKTAIGVNCVYHTPADATKTKTKI